MAVVTLKKVTVNLVLNNGTDSQGHVKTVNSSLGNLSETNYDDDKALAVVSALQPCMSKTLVSVQRNDINNLTAA